MVASLQRVAEFGLKLRPNLLPVKVAAAMWCAITISVAVALYFVCPEPYVFRVSQITIESAESVMARSSRSMTT